MFSRAGSAATLTLAWDPPADGITSGYFVLYGTQSGAYTHTIDAGMVTTYTVDNLADGVTYYFAVQAYDSSRRVGPLSSEASGSTGVTTTPPRNLSAQVNALAVALTWEAGGSGVLGYRIEIGRGPSQSNVGTIATDAATTFTVNGLVPGTYYIRVRSVTAGGVSSPSNEVVVSLGGAVEPQPPANLTATLVNGSQIHLQWQPPNDAVESYRVEIGTAAGQSNVRTRAAQGNATGLVIDDLRGGPYYIRLRSVRGGQVSAPSNEASMVAAPSAPRSPWTRVRKRRYIDVAWTPPESGADSYTIYVGTTPGAGDVHVGTTSGTDYALNEIPNGTYYLHVRAQNSAGLGDPSSAVQAVVNRGRGPAPPSDLSATIRDGNTIELSWTPGDSSTQFYRVELGTELSRTDISSFTTGATTSFTIGELPARTYYIRVLAGNDELGFGDPTEDIVVGGSGGSDAPRRLAALADVSGMFRLVWDPPEDATGVLGYVVEAGTGPGRDDLASAAVQGHDFVGGPIPHGTYFVRVRAATAGGTGAASNEVILQVGQATQCTAPPGMPRLTAGAVGNLMHLSWAPGIGEQATGYVLDVGSSPGRRDLGSFPIGGHNTTLTAQVANGSYALRLIAVNGCGASAWGADAWITVGGSELPLPGAPVNFGAQVAGRGVALAWSPPATGGAPTSYIIEVLAPTGTVMLSLDTGNTSTVFMHGEVPPGQYTVQVRAVNARGRGAASNQVVVTIP